MIYKPEHFGLTENNMVVIGTVALTGGPVSLSSANMPKIAISQNAGQNASIRSVGKEDSMFTITAVYGDEFVSGDIDVAYKGWKIPGDMLSLIALLNKMPYVPIYSSKLFKIIGNKDDKNRGYVFAVMNSIRVTAISDLANGYEVTMSFIPTNIDSFSGGVISFIDKNDKGDHQVAYMYESSKIKAEIAESRNYLKTSYGSTSNIYIGLNLSGLMTSYNTYKRRVINSLKSLPVKYLSSTEKTEIANAESYFENGKIPETIKMLGESMNAVLEKTADGSDSIMVSKKVGEIDSTTLIFRNVNNLSIGYDNYLAPTYISGSNRAVHSFMGRSPISAEINMTFEKPEDVYCINEMYSSLQEMVRSFDVLGHNMPCVVGGEPFSLFGSSTSTITRLDLSSVPEIPGSFNMKISLADGSKGVYDEEAGVSTFTLTNDMMLRFSKSLCDKIASGNSAKSEDLMQKFIEEGAEKVSSNSEYENLTLSNHMCGALDESYRSIIKYSVAAALFASAIPREEYNKGIYGVISKIVGYDGTFDIGKNLVNKITDRWDKDPKLMAKESEILIKMLSVMNYIFNSDLSLTDADSFLNKGYGELLVEASNTGRLNKFYKYIFNEASREDVKRKINYSNQIKMSTDSNHKPIPETESRVVFNFVLLGSKLSVDYSSDVSDYLGFYIRNNTVVGQNPTRFGYSFIKLYDLLTYLEYKEEFAVFNDEIHKEYDYSGSVLVERDKKDIVQDRIKFVERHIQIAKNLNLSSLDEILTNMEALLDNLKIDGARYGIIELEEDDYVFSFDFNSRVKFDLSKTTDVSNSVAKNIIPFTTSALESISSSDYEYEYMTETLMDILDYTNTSEEGYVRPVDPEFNRGHAYKYIESFNRDITNAMVEDFVDSNIDLINLFMKKFVGKLKSDENAINKFITFQSATDDYFAYAMENLIAFLKLPLTMYNVDISSIYGDELAKIIAERFTFSSAIDDVKNYYISSFDKSLLNKIYESSSDISDKLSAIITGNTGVVDGELKYVDQKDIGGFVLNEALADINKIIEWSNDPRIKSKYTDIMLNQIISGSSDSYLNEEDEKVKKELLDEKLIKLDGDVYSLNAKMFEDPKIRQKSTEKLLDILSKSKKDDSGIFVDESSYAFNNTSFFESVKGAEDSIPGLEDISPKFYVSFMWTKKNFFQPVTYQLEYKSIVSVDIQKSREDPAHKAIVVLSNTSKKLDDNSFSNQTADFQTVENKEENFIGPNVDKLLVKPGVAMGIYAIHRGRQVRMFEGTITSASYEDTTVTVTADGFGADLLKPVFNSDQKLGGLCTNPREMVVDALTKTESERFGIDTGNHFNRFIEVMKNVTDRRNILWMYSDRYLFPNFRYREVAANVFAPDKYWPILTNKFFQHFEQYFADYKAKAGYSAWDVITDAVNRVPGFIAYPIEYDIGEVRLFFGKPDWPYRFTRIVSKDFWMGMLRSRENSVKSSITALENTISNIDENILNSIESEFSMISEEFGEQINTFSVDHIKTSGYDYAIPRNITRIEDEILPYIDTSDALRIYDGDTVYFEDTSYRLAGIDAPELISDPENEAEFLERKKGINSTNALEYLVTFSSDKMSRIVDTGMLDKYDRHIAHLYLYINGEWINANQIMLASGYAVLMKSYKISDNDSITNKFYAFSNYSPSSYEEVQSDTVDYFIDSIDDMKLEMKARTEDLFKDIYTMIDSVTLNQDTDSDDIASVKNKLDALKTKINKVVSYYLDLILDNMDTTLLRNLSEKGTLLGSGVDTCITMNVNAIKSSVENLGRSFDLENQLKTQILNMEALSTGEKDYKRSFLYSKAFNNITDIPGTQKFRRYWSVVSGLNLISNEIIADSTNVANRVTVRGLKATDIFETIASWFIDFFTGTLGQSDGKYGLYTVMADDDIPDWEKRPLVVTDDFADTRQTRILVATSILINSLKNMYQGKIRMLGNPEIKPHDIISIFDRENKMFGQCVVRTVRHMYGNGISFVTELEVDPIINARDLTSSLAATIGLKLGTLCLVAGLFAVVIGTGPVGAAIVGAKIGAGLISGKIAQDIANSLTQYTNISAISESATTENEMRPYLNSFEGFNVLDIKPLTKNGRPLVAGLNGYSISNTNATEYVNKKLSESWDNFIKGMQTVGETYKYLFDEVGYEIRSVVNDYKSSKAINNILNGGGF